MMREEGWRTSSPATIGWRARRAPRSQALGLRSGRARQPEPGDDRRLRAARRRRRQAGRLSARPDEGDVRRRAGPVEGQDRPHRPSRLHRRVRHHHRDRRLRDGAAPLRPPGRARPRRRGGARRSSWKPCRREARSGGSDLGHRQARRGGDGTSCATLSGGSRTSKSTTVPA